METVSALFMAFIWVVVIGISMLTVFVSIIVIGGWADLVVQHSSLFEYLRSPQRQIAVVFLLYVPILVNTSILIMRNGQRFGANLCIVNFLPFWWLIGAIGILLIGIQSNRPEYVGLIRALFLTAALCYAVILILLLIPTDAASGPIMPNNMTIFLNFFMTCGFAIAVLKPMILRSWWRLVIFFSLIIVLAYLLDMFVKLIPAPSS